MSDPDTPPFEAPAPAFVAGAGVYFCGAEVNLALKREVIGSMALAQCPECKRGVSSTAGACPHCGYKIKKPEYLEIVGAGFMAVLLNLLIFNLEPWRAIFGSSAPERPHPHSNPSTWISLLAGRHALLASSWSLGIGRIPVAVGRHKRFCRCLSAVFPGKSCKM